MSGPLAGIRVLEVGHMLAGPYCGMLLADLGAEVIKIESAQGDIARTIGPHRVGPHNAYFASLNRSKKSVVLDLAVPEGQAALHALARDAHALVANLRPSAIRKLGLTYAALREVNPRLVCVALTGYGLEGSWSEKPAYDYVIQALTGMMALTGDPGGPPTKAGYSAVDNSAGIMGALGLVAKIVEGKGGQVDVAMFDVMLSQLNYLAGAWLNAGERAQRHARSAHPYIVPAQLFETADGWLILFITHDEFWRAFCTAAGRPEWLADERFATMAARAAHRDTVLAAIADLLRGRTTADWVARLEPLGLVVSRVAALEDALTSDLAAERGMVVAIDAGAHTLRAVGNPIRIHGHETRYAPPPLLGEHTAAYVARSARGRSEPA
jgi:crotonobetainyl-CoA:carnitine CoA-transferase CaiB-like acyl-CoA transferase